MSAALSLPLVWAAHNSVQPAAGSIAPAGSIQLTERQRPAASSLARQEAPIITWAFYRKHTENLLRRYLYASMQIGRSPCLLADSVERGWASSRTIRTFEDALIFVLDVERCLKKLSAADRQLISRVVVQEYTQNETAALLGISSRTVQNKLPQALDRLTESLVTANLLNLPD